MSHSFVTSQNLPGSSVLGISQARILEWVAISFSKGSSWPRDQTCVSYISCISKKILYHWAIREAWTRIKNSIHILVNSMDLWKWKWGHSVVSNSLPPHDMEPTRLLHPWDFPGKSTGLGCHFLLQGIFPTQGSNPVLPRCRQTLYRLSHQGSPKV